MLEPNLQALPTELLLIIVSHINDIPTYYSLYQTCRRLHLLLKAVLSRISSYKRKLRVSSSRCSRPLYNHVRNLYKDPLATSGIACVLFRWNALLFGNAIITHHHLIPLLCSNMREMVWASPPNVIVKLWWNYGLFRQTLKRASKLRYPMSFCRLTRVFINPANRDRDDSLWNIHEVWSVFFLPAIQTLHVMHANSGDPKQPSPRQPFRIPLHEVIGKSPLQDLVLDQSLLSPSGFVHHLIASESFEQFIAHLWLRGLPRLL